MNGNGGSFQIGGESAVSIHMKNNSLEIGTNTLGRLYGKYTYYMGDGYGYNKISINFPEIIAVAVVVIYAPEVVGSVGAIGSSVQLFK